MNRSTVWVAGLLALSLLLITTVLGYRAWCQASSLTARRAG
jgi:quinol-cytochrome oxidoreductase complex cytochrome b subunit